MVTAIGKSILVSGENTFWIILHPYLSFLLGGAEPDRKRLIIGTRAIYEYAAMAIGQMN
jgi:hypothetical protein